MEKQFSERFEENYQKTLRYNCDAFKNACNRMYHAINDCLINVIKRLL